MSLGEVPSLLTTKDIFDQIGASHGCSYMDVPLVKSASSWEGLAQNIIVVDVNDQKPVKDWTTKGGQQLSCPAIFCLTTGQYATVINETTLVMWNKDDLVIDKTKKIRLGKSVHRLVSCPSGRHVITYEDGTFCQMDKPSDFQGKPITCDTDSIAWCGFHCLKEMTYLVFVIRNSTNKSLLRIRAYQLESDMDDSQILEWQISDNVKNNEPLDFSLQYQNSQLYLLILWPGGELLRSCLTGTEELGIISQITSTATILALDNTQIAVAGILNETKQAGLGIWDVRFRILLSWQPFVEAVKAKAQLYCHHGNLFSMCGKQLCVYPFSMSPSTVGSALGKFGPRAHMSEESSVSKLGSVLNDLISPTKTPTENKFKDTFAKFISCVATHNEDVWRHLDLVELLVKRCVNEKKFWPREQLLKLIKNKCLTGSMCPCLFPALVNHRDVVLFHNCLLHIRDIPEACLVQCLSFYVRTDDNKFSIELDDSVDVNGSSNVSPDGLTCPFGNEKATLINRLLTYPSNDIFLIESLRTVDFQTILDLLGYLFYLMNATTVPTVPNEKPLSRSRHGKPSLLKVVDWASVLLDAHLTQMVLSPEARKILVELHQVVVNQVHFYDELVSLEGLLAQLRQSRAPSNKQTIGHYCIEMLHIA
ncbi:Nucleolar protein 11-like [Lamellibrachia satsuma]|nr:Nucleolar protein 11-like [Lamellibrachia satsuma]